MGGWIGLREETAKVLDGGDHDPREGGREGGREVLTRNCPTKRETAVSFPIHKPLGIEIYVCCCM